MLRSAERRQGASRRAADPGAVGRDASVNAQSAGSSCCGAGWRSAGAASLEDQPPHRLKDKRKPFDHEQRPRSVTASREATDEASRPSAAASDLATRTVALIPAHNEAMTIRGIVVAALPHVDAVLVIDDGSTDGTTEVLAGSGARVLRHAKNAGKGRRLLEGLSACFEAGASQVVTLDADGQHDPAAIPSFLACARAHPGALVLGDRSAEAHLMPGSRAFGNRVGSFFVGWACGRRLRDAQCGMRLYPAQMWRTLQVPSRQVDRFLFETAVLFHAAEAGVHFVTLPIAARYEGFVHRPSHFDPVGDFLAIAGMVTGFLCSRYLRPRRLLASLRVEPNAGKQEKVGPCKS